MLPLGQVQAALSTLLVARHVSLSFGITSGSAKMVRSDKYIIGVLRHGKGALAVQFTVFDRSGVRRNFHPGACFKQILKETVTALKHSFLKVAWLENNQWSSCKKNH
ncbi:MAG: hypothetical protein LW629_09870 [Burkholderiales bacterium]|jgi:hypothetical protein|nr:hypothetical protein [Burkholderiales bacterium]